MLIEYYRAPKNSPSGTLSVFFEDESRPYGEYGTDNTDEDGYLLSQRFNFVSRGHLKSMLNACVFGGNFVWPESGIGLKEITLTIASEFDEVHGPFDVTRMAHEFDEIAEIIVTAEDANAAEANPSYLIHPDDRNPDDGWDIAGDVTDVKTVESDDEDPK